MKYTENALNILTTKSYEGVGNAWIHNNLNGNEPLEVICEIIRTKDPKAIEEDFQQKRNEIERKILLLGEENCDGVVALGDRKFPSYNGKVNPADRPVALFYKGDLSLLLDKSHKVAVIGLLAPDDDTQKDERRVVNSLVKKGATIVSGLAEGCDSIAHHQALISKGSTVAILPCTLNNIIPSSRIPLANAIIERGGLIVTEYYTQPQSREQISRYIERDRLQALYSDMVILTSSYAKNNSGNDSGSRHAMEKAKNYGLYRGVIYNQVRNNNNPKYDLNRQIISEEEIPFIIDPDNCEPTLENIFSKLNSKAKEAVRQGSLF